jgi:hypothetical protein
LLLNLAGLSIRRIEGEAPDSRAQDLVWRHHHVPRLDQPDAAEAAFIAVRHEPETEGARSLLTFGHGNRARCRFGVGADGRSVESWATPDVSDRDLLALFGEHILRSVLVRRGLLSFHAASLSDGAGTILIMGDKGAGKSTLSFALQQRGWTPVADDLTRVAEDGAAWRAFAGLRATKLLATSLEAIGLDEDALPPRWDDSEGAADGKRLLVPASAPPASAEALRLRAFLVLKPRRAEGGVVHRIASPIDAVRALLEHATVDVALPEAMPAPDVQRQVGALVRSLPVVEIALPDRLDALAASARAVEDLVRRP